MKNYIAEFMKDNGLVERQGFKIKSIEDRIFFIEKNQLRCIENSIIYGDTLLELLRGKLQIEHLPFKPKDGQHYYYYFPRNDIISNCQFNADNIYDLSSYKLGNCFKTKEQCELAIPKLKQMYEDIRKELQE